MVTKEFYGKTAQGEDVSIYWLENSKGAKISILDYGCCIVNWLVPNADGKQTDIVWGCKDLAGYERDTSSLGRFVGRFANRIEHARFAIDGKGYQLEANSCGNHLHGVWTSKVFCGTIIGKDTVDFRYTSPDGEDGFPGQVEVSVRCTLTENNELVLDYSACSDAATPINLTNHTYFNLDGAESRSVLGHKMQLWADNYTPANQVSCPTGAIEPVAGTPMDFSTMHAIGDNINEPFQQLIWGTGYDHNYIINKDPNGIAKAARVEAENSGIWLECYTTQPGIQIYTANFSSDNGDSKEGFLHTARGAVCLETQNFPCAPNRENFPNSILRPGKLLRETTVYAFGCDK